MEQLAQLCVLLAESLDRFFQVGEVFGFALAESALRLERPRGL